MDDTQEKLKSYIRQQLQTGQTPDEISGQLSAAGWPQDHIQAAFVAVQNQILPTPMQAATVAQQPGSSAPAAASSAPQANGKRRGRIKTGWILFKESVNILRGNKYLLRYLLMTWAAVIAFNIIIFLIIYFGYNIFSDAKGDYSAKWYILAFFCYLITYSIVNFYAAALASNILDLFKGIRKPYNEYIKRAKGKFWPIFVYSLIESIIGMILRYIVERIRWVGWIVAWLLGTVWSLGTMFVLPLIMDTDVSGTKAIKQSVTFFKQTWGENITAKVTVNGPLFIIQLLLFLIFIPVFIEGSVAGVYAFLVIIVLVYLFLMLNVAIVGSFANSLINVALYYYAVHREVPPGFDADMLNRVFIKRKRRFFKKVED
jgi:hypothetical protein